jgi:hypothetical protein
VAQIQRVLQAENCMATPRFPQDPAIFPGEHPADLQDFACLDGCDADNSNRTALHTFGQRLNSNSAVLGELRRL